MKLLNVACATLVVAGLAFLGWLCVARTSAMVEWHERHYPTGVARLISKAWFPGYLRFMGIFIWLFDLLILWGLFGKLP
jgi:hypothetical protein